MKRLQANRAEARRPTVTFVGDTGALVLALQARSNGAIAAFYDQFAPYVVRLLGRMVGYCAELEDLVQETFVRAIEAIARLRELERLKPWLRGIAVNVALEHLRRRRRWRWLPWRHETGDQTGAAEPAARGASVDHSAHDRVVLRRVQALLDRFDERERVIFCLRHLEGMELAEIAEACDASLSTVRRSLQHTEVRFRTMATHDPALIDLVQSALRSES
jgi:RNA polymerase sigma-70 factor (ECF subfamily)